MIITESIEKKEKKKMQKNTKMEILYSILATRSKIYNNKTIKVAYFKVFEICYFLILSHYYHISF